jgi:serine/threonine protein phosphatase 1
MFSLFRRKPAFVARDYWVPPHTRLYVVGDIHGRLDLLDSILEQIEEDVAAHPLATPRYELIFLGDYVDRGFHSRQVLARLREGLPAGFVPVFLRGNHEDAMLRFYEGDLAVGLDWFHFGGRETLASYGIPLPPQNLAKDKVAAIHAEFRAAVAPADVAFLRSTQLHYVCGDYTFVHAGLRPGLPLEQQLREDLLFIRNDFMQSDDDFGTMVVHGHTIVEEPEVKANRISIDTGAYATGRLTCLILEGSGHRFLQS